MSRSHHNKCSLLQTNKKTHLNLNKVNSLKTPKTNNNSLTKAKMLTTSLKAMTNNKSPTSRATKGIRMKTAVEMT